MSKIAALRIRDFKRIADIEIDAEERALVVLGGRNGAGKSSALDAITAALTGGKAIPDEPIRRGEERSEITVSLDDGVTVRRTITRREGGGYGGTLTIRTADGMRPQRAQGWLDERIGDLSCDPLAFMSARPSDQADQLRGIVGVDTRELDARRRALYDDRRDLGRDGKRAAGALDSMPSYPDAPEEEVQPEVVSASDVLSEISAARQSERAAEEARRDLEAHRRQITEERQRHSALIRAIAELEERLLQVREQEAQAEGGIAELEATETGLVERVDELAASEIDIAPLQERLSGVERANAEARERAETINRQVRANAAHAAMAAEVQALREGYARCTAAIEQIDADKTAMLAAAEFPVEGLGFDADGNVTLHGLPLAQASGAEKIRVSMAIALAGDPEIRVVLIRDASLLDDESMGLVVELAEQADAQVWLERVGDADPGVIVIEDGGIR